jgi:DNA-binding CsgD family transcriptional regulator
MIRVSSPRFIGRTDELDAIARAIERAATRDGPLLIVAGEAGVGKTRLIDEATETARRSGVAAVVGRCVELSGSSAPFTPLAHLLRELRSELGTGSIAEGTAWERLRALDDLADPAPSRDPVGMTEDSRQVRFFEAWLDLLEAVGTARPLLVVIEDIHWADRSTLDWLAYVARGRTRPPYTLLVTLRSDELHRRHPIQSVLAELRRLPNAERLEIGRFDRAEVAEQIAAISGATPDEELVDRVYSRSDGNAFFSEELIAVGDDLALPDDLRDVVLARLSQLGQGTKEMLRVASVAGDRFAGSRLARVMGVDIETVEPGLRDAVDRQVVRPIEGGGRDDFTFRHALTREAVYGDLLPGERARLHAKFALALEDEPGGTAGRSAELAYHWLAAYDLPRALDASLAAAREADAVHGYAESLQHYDRAIELWDRVPDAAARSGMDRTGLLESAADSAARTDTDRAMALVTAAIAAAPDDAGPLRIALLKERYGRYAWLAGDGVTALEACGEAARLVDDQAPTRERARVLASHAQILMVTVQMEAAGPVAAEAFAIARAIGASDIETHALTTLGVCTVYVGRLELGLEQIRAARAIAEGIDSVDDIDRADSNLVDVLANSGMFREAADVAIAAAAFATRHGVGRILGTWQLAEGALALYRLGEWSEARELLDRSAALSPTGALRIATEERAALLDVGQGRFDDAEARIAATRPMIERAVEAQLITPLTEAIVELALWQNRPEIARDAIAETLTRLPVAEPGYISRIGPVLGLATRTEADIAIVARARGDEPLVRDSQVAAGSRVAAMRVLAEAARAERKHFAGQADAWLAICEAEVRRLEGASDPSAWQAAGAAFEAIPMAYPRAYALWRSAEASLAAGWKRDDAKRPLQEARGLADRLAAVPLLHEIDALASRARMDLAEGAEPGLTPGAEPGVTPGPTRGSSMGLTKRELEVLRLIAAGRSNRQIAEHLFITEGTAGTHVSNILGKLGVRGRTEAAAIAYRLELVD